MIVESTVEHSYIDSDTSKPRLEWPGYAACVWSLLFAAISFYWAAGGTAGADTIGDAITEPALAREPMWVAILWASAVFKLAGAGLALLLLGVWASVVLRRLLLVCGWGAAIILSLYGGLSLIQHALMAADILDLPNSLDLRAVRWHLAMWDPVWLLGGILFALATVQYSRATANR
jgi:hypothetical protein